MRITDVSIQRYALPLVKPLTVGHAHITVREGLVVVLHSDTGLLGHGEVAPLPGLHKETLAEAVDQLAGFRSDLQPLSLTPDMLTFNGQLSQILPSDLFPSVRAGVEMATLDILLQQNSALASIPESLPVNALLANGNKPLAERVEELTVQGYKSIKIKVARQSLEKDIEDIQTVLSLTQGRALLRLDANRRWTLSQAMQFCEAIEPQGIEYIEEPTQDPSGHMSLSKSSRIPIALDETLAEIPCDELAPECYRALVLKPGVLGGFENIARIIRWARENHITPVLSSAFETSLAVRMYLFFAALSGIVRTPLGLDTGKWFKEDLLLMPLIVEKGRVPLASLLTRPKLNQRFLSEVVC